MPKLAKTPYEKRRTEVRALFEYWFTMRGITGREDKARIMNVKSLQTVTSRRKNPESYTLEELWNLQASLQIPQDEFLALFKPLR